jgi:Uma2 family endonuclease
MVISMNTAMPLPQPEQQPHRHRFSVQEYYQLAEAGIFNEDSRVELIEGEIIDMPPIGALHSGWTTRLNGFFARLVPTTIGIQVQNPIHLDDGNEPQPDLALLAPREQSYLEAHPRAEDVLLLIEVADSSLGYDHDVKIPLYGRHGVAESWLFDAQNHSLIIYRHPSENGYREIYRPRMDERIALSALPDVTVDLEAAFRR